MERTLTEKKLVFFSKNEKDDIDEIAANCLTLRSPAAKACTRFPDFVHFSKFRIFTTSCAISFRAGDAGVSPRSRGEQI